MPNELNVLANAEVIETVNQCNIDYSGVLFMRVFSDLSKAFERIDQNVLLNKLISKGLTVLFVHIFRSVYKYSSNKVDFI